MTSSRPIRARRSRPQRAPEVVGQRVPAGAPPRPGSSFWPLGRPRDRPQRPWLSGCHRRPEPQGRTQAATHVGSFMVLVGESRPRSRRAQRLFGSSASARPALWRIWRWRSDGAQGGTVHGRLSSSGLGFRLDYHDLRHDQGGAVGQRPAQVGVDRDPLTFR